MKLLIMLLLSALLGVTLAAAQSRTEAESPLEAEARIFMDMFEAGFKEFNVGMSEEYWKFYTRGDPGRTDTYEKIQSEILSDPQTRGWRAGGERSPIRSWPGGWSSCIALSPWPR